MLNLYYEPKVYPASFSIAKDPGIAQFYRDEVTDVPPAPWENCSGDRLPEVAGRICYMSFANPRPGGNAAYLRHIKEAGHGSVLEHSTFGFILTGISRSLSHELVRHRAGLAYSQLSQRYVDESGVGFVVPPGLRGEVESAEKGLARWGGELTAAGVVGYWREAGVRRDKGAGGSCSDALYEGLKWLAANEAALKEYAGKVEYLARKYEAGQPAGQFIDKEKKRELRKAARGTARSVLPNCTETKIFVTGNARAWRHCVEQRCSRHADPEIRILLGKVWESLAGQSPNLFGDYERRPLPDGTFELTTPCRKV